MYGCSLPNKDTQLPKFVREILFFFKEERLTFPVLFFSVYIHVHHTMLSPSSSPNYRLFSSPSQTYCITNIIHTLHGSEVILLDGLR